MTQKDYFKFFQTYSVNLRGVAIVLYCGTGNHLLIIIIIMKLH